MLTQPQRIQISGEMLDIPLRIQAANATNAQIAVVKTDLQARDSSVKIFFDKYNLQTNSYQNERKWLDGTTYSEVLENDVQDSAKRAAGNKFYPTDGSWVNFQPKLHDSAVGNPTSNSTNNELQKFIDNIEDLGLLSTIDFILNGQSSGVANDTLAAPYIPGSGTMQVTTGGQTIGKLIQVKGGGFSGLFKITNITTLVNLDVIEVVPPNGTLPMSSSNVLENITAFTNTERNTLTSTFFQNVLTGITSNLTTAISSWETLLNNQLTELNNNTDNRVIQLGEITNAKNDINNSKSIIDAWQALPNTGTTGTDSKFVNVNINNIYNEILARQTFATTRATQVTTALGSVSQIGDGSFSGTGIYHERFKQIDLRINLAGGPLTEYYEKNAATSALTQIVNTATNTKTTYETELRTEKITADGNNTNIIAVTSVTGFSISDSVYVISDTQIELTGTITNISGTNIQLSFTVSSLYKVADRLRIYKQL